MGGRFIPSGLVTSETQILLSDANQVLDYPRQNCLQPAKRAQALNRIFSLIPAAAASNTDQRNIAIEAGA